jgi:hypothetical protein
MKSGLLTLLFWLLIDASQALVVVPRPLQRSSTSTSSGLFRQRSGFALTTDKAVSRQPVSLKSGTLYFEATSDNSQHNSLLQAYIDACERRPFIVKSLSSGAVGLVGNILSQVLQCYALNTAFVMNWHRAWVFTLTSALYVGPFLHIWFMCLDNIAKRVPQKYNTIAKLLIDQTVGVLLFYPSFFYAHELSEALLGFRCKWT